MTDEAKLTEVKVVIGYGRNTPSTYVDSVSIDDEGSTMNDNERALTGLYERARAELAKRGIL